MKIKDTLQSYLSFGEKLKVKNDDNYPYSTANKLTFGSSAVKSALNERDLKSVMLTALLNTLPFAFICLGLYIAISLIGGVVLNSLNHFAAGFLCYFIFVLIELLKGNINHYKTHDILKPSLFIAGITFLLSCGTAIRQIYHIITNKYLTGTIFDFSAVSIIFTIVFVAILTKGKFEKNLNTLLSLGLSVLYLSSNITYIKTLTAIVYIRMALVLAMLVLMVLTLIKEKGEKKLNYKTPLIILGGAVGIALIIGLVLLFVFKDINQIKFTLSTTFAALFGGDLTSLSLLENTIGGGVVTDNSSLYGLISTISYIAPGSYLINAITLSSFNMGFHGEYGIIVGLLYAVMGLAISLGVTLSGISLVMEAVKCGKSTTRLVTIKRWVSAAVSGFIPVTMLAMLSSFVDLMRVSFSGAWGLIFGAALVAIIYVLSNTYKVNRNLLAICSGAFTLLVMIFAAGVKLF